MIELFTLAHDSCGDKYIKSILKTHNLISLLKKPSSLNFSMRKFQILQEIKYLLLIKPVFVVELSLLHCCLPREALLLLVLERQR